MTDPPRYGKRIVPPMQSLRTVLRRKQLNSPVSSDIQKNIVLHSSFRINAKKMIWEIMARAIADKVKQVRRAATYRIIHEDITRKTNDKLT